MGAVMLLPGGGGRYLSEIFATAITGADEIDCSACSELAIQQIIVGSPSGTYQVEERLGGTGAWAPLGIGQNISADGTINKFNSASRPFSHIRFNFSTATVDSSDTVQLKLQGGRVAGGSIF